MASDFVEFVETAGSALLTKLTTHRDVEEKLTKLLGHDDLVGSAGEFGLLFAFLANEAPAPRKSMVSLRSPSRRRGVFVDKRLPDGWETWKKSRIDWVRETPPVS